MAPIIHRRFPGKKCLLIIEPRRHILLREKLIGRNVPAIYTQVYMYVHACTYSLADRAAHSYAVPINRSPSGQRVPQAIAENTIPVLLRLLLSVITPEYL